MVETFKEHKTVKRKIAVITGSRAEYGYLRPLIEKIKESEGLELLLYVSGMHLLKMYGNTLQEIRKDGHKITRIIDMNIKANNTPFDISVSIGRGVTEFAKAFQDDRPDIVVVFGDRVEPFAAAAAAAPMSIPIAHISGGEVGLGDIDNSLRHAITKLAHLHFTSSSQSEERVRKLGEEEWRVFRVGALSLDILLNEKLLSKKGICKRYNLACKPLILISYHPVTSEFKDARNQIELVISAALEVANEENMEIVIIYPNAYPGGFQMIRSIKRIAKENKRIHVFANLPQLDYLSLLSNSSVFLGNSSSGIIEAPSLGIPFVCIGTRQKGRERAKNVVDVEYSKNEIVEGIKKALFDREFIGVVKRRESPYGDGKASSRIVRVLSKIEIDKKLLEKVIAY